MHVIFFSRKIKLDSPEGEIHFHTCDCYTNDPVPCQRHSKHFGPDKSNSKTQRGARWFATMWTNHTTTRWTHKTRTLLKYEEYELGGAPTLVRAASGPRHLTHGRRPFSFADFRIIWGGDTAAYPSSEIRKENTGLILNTNQIQMPAQQWEVFSFSSVIFWGLCFDIREFIAIFWIICAPFQKPVFSTMCHRAYFSSKNEKL